MTVIEQMTEYEHIFDSVTVFEPLQITSADLYSYFVVCFADLKYLYNVTRTTNIVSSVTKINEFNLNKAVQALLIDYKPLENYNRTEMSKVDGDTIDTHNLNQSITTNETPNGYNTTEQVVPFNAVGFSDTSKTIVTPQDKTTTQTVRTEDENHNIIRHDYHDNNMTTISGNIGVTTSQQMLLSELELRTYNIIDEYLKKISQFILNLYKGKDKTI